MAPNLSKASSLNIRQLVAMLNNNGTELYEQGKLCEARQLFEKARKIQNGTGIVSKNIISQYDLKNALAKKITLNYQSQSQLSAVEQEEGPKHKHKQSNALLDESCRAEPTKDANCLHFSNTRHAAKQPHQRRSSDVAHGMYCEEEGDDPGTESFNTPFKIALDYSTLPAIE
eukprot:6576373-Ditylum_brightwellii.AAC.1